MLRNQVVTSLTLRMKPDWMSQAGGAGGSLRAGASRKLLLSDRALPNINEVEGLESNDPSEYRNLMMRLCDLQYICIKAAVDVSDTGEIEEREYWLPLEETQTVADLKKLIIGGDRLEAGADGPTLLEHGSDETELSMVLRGRPLEDGRTLMQEGLTPNSVVHLFVKKDANITVKMLGTKDLEVKLNANETAESLRAKLAALRPSGALKPLLNADKLFYGGQELKDGPLNMYGVTDGATLELRPYMSAKGVTVPMTPARHSWGSNSLQGAAHSGGQGAFSVLGGTPGGSLPPGGSWRGPGSQSGRSWMSGAMSTMGGMSSMASMAPSSSECSNSPSSPPTPIGSPLAGSPLMDMARSFDLAREGLAMGNRPQLASGGTGGAYFLRGSDGETCAVFKPADEEPCARNNPRGRNVTPLNGEGLRKGTRVGEGASREVAAYLLDHGGFAGVPATSLANLCEMRRTPSGKDLGGKLGSLQAFVRADAEAEELGPGLFPTGEVHKITQLDIRLANTDRNAGNILVQNSAHGSLGGAFGGEEGLRLVPIDHGYALPHTLEDVCFEWEFWPQAKVPYNAETRAYIAAIHVESDVALLRDQGIELQPSSERVLRVCTTLLQKAAAIGCCPADIAGMMSRVVPNCMSDLEKLTSRAASQAVAAVRAQDGLEARPGSGGIGGLGGGGGGEGTGTGLGSSRAWEELDLDERCEVRFMVEYGALLDSYLEGYEPELGGF